MPDRADSEITQLLGLWAGGNRDALDALMPLVYGELHKIAHAYLKRERQDHTLQPTALINEAWLRLVRQDQGNFTHRRQFFGLAAQVMRRILVDHARTTKAEKRGGKAAETSMAGVTMIAADDRRLEFLALDQALERLARVSERQARIIEMRYFAGLGVEELAEVLGVSIATISRDQKIAEAWLAHAMASADGTGRHGA